MTYHTLSKASTWLVLCGVMLAVSGMAMQRTDQCSYNSNAKLTVLAPNGGSCGFAGAICTFDKHSRPEMPNMRSPASTCPGEV